PDEAAQHAPGFVVCGCHLRTRVWLSVPVWNQADLWGASTFAICSAKSRCALSRSVATSKVYLVAASTPGSAGTPGTIGRSGTGSTDTALTQVWAASMDICCPCCTVDTSCSRIFWASSGISLVGVVLVVVVVIGTPRLAR